MTDDQPAVKVTLGTIYEKLLEVDKKVDPLPAAVLDHEARIRSLEKHMWARMGAAAVAGAVLSFFSKFLIPQ